MATARAWSADAALGGLGAAILGAATYGLVAERAPRRDPAAGQAAVVGTIQDVANTVRSRPAALPAWDDVATGQPLHAHDLVYTGSQSRSTIVMNNDARLAMEENSLIEIDLVGPGSHIDVKHGAVLISALKSAEDLTFSVNGYEGVVGAHSSSALVNVNRDGSADVTVLSGRAKLGKGKTSVETGPSQRRRIARDGRVSDAAPLLVTLASPAWGEAVLAPAGGALKLAWNTVAPVADARLQIAASADFTRPFKDLPVAGRDAAVSGLPGGTYYWRIVAHAAGTGRLETSDVRQLQVIALDPPRPRRPLAEERILHPEDGAEAGRKTVVFDWDPVEGATGYELEIAPSGAGGGPAAASGAGRGFGAGQRIAREAGPYAWAAPADGRYAWRARSLFKDGQNSPWTLARPFVVAAEAPPLKPPEMEPADGLVVDSYEAAPAVRFAVARPAAAGGPGISYAVELAEDAGFEQGVKHLNLAAAGTTWAAPAAGTYFWRVRAEDRYGRASPWAAPRRLAIRARAPELLSPSSRAALTRRGATAPGAFRWTPRWGASAYRLEIAASADFRAPLVDTTTAATAYTWPEAAPGTYFWRVTATNAGAGDMTSAAGQFQVTRPPPLPAPVLKPVEHRTLDWEGDGGWNWQAIFVPVAYAEDGDRLRTKLAWAQVPGANGYHLQVARDRAFTDLVVDTTLAAPLYLWSVPEPGVYYYRVAAIDAEGTPSAFSNAATLALKLPEPRPLAPAADAALILGAGERAHFAWEGARHAAAYALEVAKDAGFAELKLSVETDQTAADMELPPGHYFWRVKARFAGGFVSDGSDPRGLTVKARPVVVPAAALDSPRAGQVLDGAEAEVSLAWRAPAGVDMCEAQLGSDRSFVAPIEDRSTLTSRTDVEISPGTYYWRVRCLIGDAAGPWTEPWSFTVAPPAPAPAAKVQGDAALAYLPTRLAYAETSPTAARRVTADLYRSLGFAGEAWLGHAGLSADARLTEFAVEGDEIQQHQLTLALLYELPLASALALVPRLGYSYREELLFLRGPSDVRTAATLAAVQLVTGGAALRLDLAPAWTIAAALDAAAPRSAEKISIQRSLFVDAALALEMQVSGGVRLGLGYERDETWLEAEAAREGETLALTMAETRDVLSLRLGLGL